MVDEDGDEMELLSDVAEEEEMELGDEDYLQKDEDAELMIDEKITPNGLASISNAVHTAQKIYMGRI